MENVESKSEWKIEFTNILRYFVKELLVVFIIVIVIFTINHIETILSFSLENLSFSVLIEYIANSSALVGFGLLIFLAFGYQARTIVGVQAARYRSPNQTSAFREFISQQAKDWHKAMASVLLIVFAVICYSISQL